MTHEEGEPVCGAATTDDIFLGGALRLLQPKPGYRAGIDPVLLAASVPLARGETESLLDIGAGVGTAGLCAARRVEETEVVLLEREPVLAELARRNITRNGLEERVRVAEGDLGASAGALAAVGLAPDSFDHVIANPPFHNEGRGTPAGHRLKSAAHAMAESDLDQWGRFMARMATPGGTATMIHKAEALGSVLAAFAGRFGDLRVLPVVPRRGEAAIRVLVQGIKASRAPMVLLDALVLHGGEGHGFTLDVDGILRGGAALDIRA